MSLSFATMAARPGDKSGRNDPDAELLSPEGKIIRLCLIDDQALLRDILTNYLNSQPDMQVVASSDSAASVLEALLLDPVDLVLLELNPKRVPALEGLRCLRQAAYQGRIVVLANCVSDEEVVRLIAYDIAGIFLKQSPPEMLLKCIRKTAAGQLWFDQHHFEAIFRRSAGLIQQHRNNFSEREKQVLLGLLEGLANKEIAARMHTRESNIKATLHHLFDRFGVRTRVQLVRIAMDQFRDDLGDDLGRSAK